MSMTQRLDPEFALVTACCLWPPSAKRNAAIAAVAATPIDWTRFLQVAKRHRVPGLVWNGLSQAGIKIPPNVAQTLKGGAEQTARAGLSFGAESIRLQRLVRAAGCECAFLKGNTLAMLAYGNHGFRHAKDIDMIVPMADVSTVCVSLKAAGYRRIRPTEAISEAQFELWRTYGKDMEWYHDAKRIDLELHWRLTELSFLLKLPPDFSALQTVKITSTESVMTLPASELFIYLCVHGAAHCWSRLKWLADVHALLAGQADSIIEGHYGTAAAQGAERAVGQALLLCADLFKLRLPGGLAATLRASRVTTTLARMGVASMMRGQAATEVHELRFGTTLIGLSHLLLARGFRAHVGEIVRKGIDLDDVLCLPLPKSLALLYWLLRIPFWVLRRTRRAGASVALRRPPIQAKSRGVNSR